MKHVFLTFAKFVKEKGLYFLLKSQQFSDTLGHHDIQRLQPPPPPLRVRKGQQMAVELITFSKEDPRHLVFTRFQAPQRASIHSRFDLTVRAVCETGRLSVRISSVRERFRPM